MICPECGKQACVKYDGLDLFDACENCGWAQDREEVAALQGRLLKSSSPFFAVPTGYRAGSTGKALTGAAREFRARRKTPPMTQAEYDALQVDLDPTGEKGLAAIDFDLETIRLLTDDLRAKHGRLPEKKLRKLQADAWERRSHERDRHLHLRD